MSTLFIGWVVIKTELIKLWQSFSSKGLGGGGEGGGEWFYEKQEYYPRR